MQRTSIPCPLKASTSTFYCRRSIRWLTLTVRGKREEVEAALAASQPIFAELIPLSLEEIFISETEVVGYDIKKLVL